MFLLTRKIRRFLLLAVLLTQAACSDIAVMINQTTAPKADSFKGISAVQITQEGYLRLSWPIDTLSDSTALAQPSYEIWLTEIASLPSEWGNSYIDQSDPSKPLNVSELDSTTEVLNRYPSRLIKKSKGEAELIFTDKIESLKFYAFHVVRSDASALAKSVRHVMLVKMNLPLPDDWSLIQSGKNAVLSWSNVTSASSYELMIDGEMREQVETTVTLENFDPLKKQTLCIRSLFGKLRSNDCLSINLPVKASSVKVESVDSSRPSGFYKAGDIIPILLKFTDTVYAIEPEQLALKVKTGSSLSLATYSGGSGSRILAFDYLIQTGDDIAALDLLNADALQTLHTSRIVDSKNAAVSLRVPFGTSGKSLASLRNLTIDTILPARPQNIVYQASPSQSPPMAVSWVLSTDSHFKRHNFKLCQNIDCATACVASDADLRASPAAMVGAVRSGYYACIQGEDSAGNTSDFVASTTPWIGYSGAVSGDVLGSWPNGTGKVQLQFNEAPKSATVNSYKVYFSRQIDIASFDLNQPIATIPYGDPQLDADPQDNKILLSRPLLDLVDGYYLVRAVDPSAAQPDANETVSSLVPVLKGHPGYVLIPKLYSGLAYDYYLMRFEASLSGPTSPAGTDTVTTDETALASCAVKFQLSGVASDASCGTKVTTKSAVSYASVPPARSLTWPQAFYSCRNATDSQARVRLPTAEEWRRASKWLGTDYSSMWTNLSSNAAGACRVSASSPANTGASSNCQTSLGLYDMGGNVSEWVDSRMTRYDINAQGESRFNFGPTIGRNLRNGLDNQTQRYHLLNPGINGLALAMGASFANQADRKQFGEDVQTWKDPILADSNVGFRCVGFRADDSPSPEVLALPNQPQYAASDISGPASTWTIPMRFYVKDAKPETVKVVVDGNLNDTVVEGRIQFAWSPWSKTVCDASGVCSTSAPTFTYQIYRFLEPNRKSIRTAIPWAIGGADSSYAADTRLDPLATDMSGNRIFHAGTSAGKLISTISNCDASHLNNCQFTDSTSAATGFLPTLIYNYMIVVKDANGNEVLPQQQVFRSRYFAGNAPNADAASFRLEPRYRRASVLPIDEAYQSAQPIPQVMVHVPMNISGMDHDFFIHKYELSQFGGDYDYATHDPPRADAYPVQSSSTWTSRAARCNDIFMRTGVLDPSPAACGDAFGSLHTAEWLLGSKAGTDRAWRDQGSFWKACRLVGLTDSQSKIYGLTLSSDTEWVAAADWGDVDQDGVIDQSVYTPNIGAIAKQIEGGPADSTTVRCNTDSIPDGYIGGGDPRTINCKSRYGVQDMVGNMTEWTSAAFVDGKGVDDGGDGIWTDAVMPSAGGNIFNFGIDLFRGRPVPVGSGSKLFDHVNNFSSTVSGSRGLVRGGFYNSWVGFTPGIWESRPVSGSTYNVYIYGGRCTF
jgi:formylglycine-generating enzyme required for sulfatase activity